MAIFDNQIQIFITIITINHNKFIHLKSNQTFNLKLFEFEKKEEEAERHECMRSHTDRKKKLICNWRQRDIQHFQVNQIYLLIHITTHSKK